MADPNREYAAWTWHPLHDVPQDVLDAARRSVKEMAEWESDLNDAELCESLADAVVMAVLPAMKRWLT